MFSHLSMVGVDADIQPSVCAFIYGVWKSSFPYGMASYWKITFIVWNIGDWQHTKNRPFDLKNRVYFLVGYKGEYQ
jgi:hypothetical protein